MSPSRETAALRFPRRRRRPIWLIVALTLAGAAILAAVHGQAPVAVTAQAIGEPAAFGGDDPGTDAGGRGSDDPGSDDAGAADDVDGDGAELPGGEAHDVEVSGTPPADDVAPLDVPPLVGEVDGLLVHQPAAEVVVIGFHEASSASFAIEPIGRLVANENRTRFDPVADRDDGVEYHILASRGRPNPPTSAVDIVMQDEMRVLAPVTGLVADVREYYLYGQHLDHRVELHPDGSPHLRVVLVHLDDVRVAAGDRVTAGRSVLAGTANRFPFTSQIDRETEPDRWPHVHLEVQAIDAPRPGDAVEE